MNASALSRLPDAEATARREAIQRTLRSYYAAMRETRRGVCLLNAGEFTQAEAAFQRAAALGCKPGQMARRLAACALGRGDPAAAAAHLEALCEENQGGTAELIRLAYAAWSAGKRTMALTTLREALRGEPEHPGLHFHLGVLLAAGGELEEAELRFTQVECIDRNHVEGLVQLALCCAARHAPREALEYLQRALIRRPDDPRIGLLTAQAAKAVQQQGHVPMLRATLPDTPGQFADWGIEDLARAVAAEPDFVEAFLSLPPDEVEKETYALLLRTLELALEHQPESAELHFHCGQLLIRLGRRDDAIARNEQALALRPRFTRALIELARLYQLTDRNDDALTRLRDAIAAGAEYADVYYLLGNVHRRRGDLSAARLAYRRALTINERYLDARLALEALTV